MVSKLTLLPLCKFLLKASGWCSCVPTCCCDPVRSACCWDISDSLKRSYLLKWFNFWVILGGKVIFCNVSLLVTFSTMASYEWAVLSTWRHIEELLLIVLGDVALWHVRYKRAIKVTVWMRKTGPTPSVCVWWGNILETLSSNHLRTDRPGCSQMFAT